MSLASGRKRLKDPAGSRERLTHNMELRGHARNDNPEKPLGPTNDKKAVLLTCTLEDLTRLIAKRNFCVLATQGSRGPHVAGVGYFARGLDIYIPTSAKTAKARNVRRNPHVAVHIAVPWPLIPAPPRSIQFRGTAEILPIDDANANAALDRGSAVMHRVFRRLLKNADTDTWGESIWLHVHPTGRIETFMVGVPMTTMFRDATKAMLHFDVPENLQQTTRAE